MAEIDDWIKEQLKKGYSKEQIKEGLRGAGYPQDVINSVDIIIKKANNKKYIFAFLIIFILVIAFFYIRNLPHKRIFNRGEVISITTNQFSSPTQGIIWDDLDELSDMFDFSDYERLRKEKHTIAHILIFYTDLYKFDKLDDQGILNQWFDYALKILPENCSDSEDTVLISGIIYSMVYGPIDMDINFASNYLQGCEKIESEYPVFYLPESYYYLFDYTKKEVYKNKFIDTLKKESDKDIEEIFFFYGVGELMLWGFACDYYCDTERVNELKTFIKEATCDGVMKPTIRSACLNKDNFATVLKRIYFLTRSNYYDEFKEEIEKTIDFLMTSDFIKTNGKIRFMFEDEYISEPLGACQLADSLINIKYKGQE
ncbi:MAG: hypothetical protein KKE93_04915 [Nanoarchaeota archaeon]|nr:hypothetical protein [Nanoarchaeota archaeon]